MDKKSIIHFATLALFALCFFTSCSNDDDILTPETNEEYGITINISTNGGGNSSIASRAMDQQGAFTAEYDATHVYMHSTTNASKYVKLKINSIAECKDCDGNSFSYTFCKNEDGSYTIKSIDGTSQATFSADEEIYFSSEESEIWEGTSVDASPVTGQSVLVRDENKNKEIYRSESNYTMQGIFDLGLNGTLVMQRKCSAFRIYFIFTDFENPDIDEEYNETKYRVTADEFIELSGLPYDNWTGKVYIGPYFCDTYNINTETAGYKDGHDYGYYVTNNQTYFPFTPVSYTRTQGKKEVQYRGYGVSTAGADYLITPYNEQSTDKFTFYAFIKNTTDDPESDINSKYVSYTFGDVPAFNTTQEIIIVYDVRELARGFNTSASTQGTRYGFWDAPEKLDIQPVKVLYINE